MTDLRRITVEKLEISTSRNDDYEKLVTRGKLFSAKHQLFAAGLAYGLLHGKRHDKKPTTALAKLFVIADKTTTSLIDVVFWVLNNKKDYKEVGAEMLHIADGGVMELSKMYDSGGGEIDISRLLDDAKNLWSERAKSLNNIDIRGSGTSSTF